MKILVVSDTHGSIESILRKVRSIERPDMIFHLGDYVEDGVRIENALNIPATIVRGNGDYGKGEFEDEQIVEVMGKRIFLSHGHKYNVRLGPQKLFYRALELGADVALYGHTHIAKILEKEGLIIMNPGSPDYPRGIIRNGSLGLIKIEEKIEARILEIK
ncbi:MAG: metallophosphoesterase [Tissierellaceae bacterium]